MFGLGRPVYQPSGRSPVRRDGRHATLDVVALLGLAHAVVVDPTPAVGDHVAVGLSNRGRGLRVLLECQTDGVGGEGERAFLEQAQDAPEPDPAAVFVVGFDVEVAPTRARHQPGHLREQGLGTGVAVEHAGLRALLVVEHQVERQARALRPFDPRRAGAVTDQIPWRTIHGGLDSIQFQLRNAFLA